MVWCLSEKCLHSLNGANAGCLHRFTDKTRAEESRETTCTYYSLCKDIRRRRLAWLGHIILRMQDSEGGASRLVKIAVKVQHEMGSGGNLLMDAPGHQHFEELEQLASDRRTWKAHSERKFGRTGKEAPAKRKSRKVKYTISQQRARISVGRWIGSGADAVWVGLTPAPKEPIPPTLPPETTARSSANITIPNQFSMTLAENKFGKKVQAQLPSAWRLGAKQEKVKVAQQKQKLKTKKVKEAALTDAQRAAWAHAHYIIHHGTKDDAARLLTNTRVARNIPAAALKSIRGMAIARVPTWEQAAAAVFSSSGESDDSIDTTSDTVSTSASQTINVTHTGIAEPPAVPAITSNIDDNTNTKNKINCDNNTASKIDNNSNTAAQRYRTRSTTVQARAMAASAAAAADGTTANPPPSARRRPRKKRGVPQHSFRPKKVRIGPSQIQGAGMGLYLMEDVNKNAWIARYSGDPLTRMECNKRRHSQYRMQVHKNLFLDAENECHFEGRYINDAKGSKFRTNARFASNYVPSTCSTTGYTWVRIYATRKIHAGEEIFINYGKDFWDNLEQHQRLSQGLPMSASTTQQVSSSSSMWAAPAPMISDEHTADRSYPTDNKGKHETFTEDTDNPITFHQQTAEWPIPRYAPADPVIVGHKNTSKYPNECHTIPLIRFPSSLSPIKSCSPPSFDTRMNEHYSFNQMYDPDTTILLPLSITDHKIANTNPIGEQVNINLLNENPHNLHSSRKS